MDSNPLMVLKSHVEGKNADVFIYADRIEWAKQGTVSLTRLTAGMATAGASLLKTGVRKGGGTEMIPVRSMSSITTGKDGLRFHKVCIICTGNVVEFRVDKAQAEEAKALLTQLMLGTHPAQQYVAGTPPAPPTASAPPTPHLPPPAAAHPAPAAAPSVVEQLKELASLRDSGVLTDEEFAQQKAKVLAQ